MAQKTPKKPQLTPELEQEIVELVIETYNKEIETHRKRSLDKKLRNTRLLLENYRGFLAFSDGAIYEASQCEEDVYDILSLMSGKHSEQEMYVESIKKSAGRTKLIIEHIKKAIADYEAYCMRSKRDEEMRRFRVVKKLYIDPDGWDVAEIAIAEMVDISTVYFSNVEINDEPVKEE